MGSISYRNRNKGKTSLSGSPLKANWEYRFYGASIRGKRQVIQKCGFPTKQEAIQAGNKAYNEYMQAGTVFKPSEMSYSDCLDAWLEDYVAIKCKETTREGYSKRIEEYIRPALGKYLLAAIKADHIQKFINSMYYKRYSRNTLSNLLGIISSSMRFAKRRGWIQFSPAEDIDLPGTRECKHQRQIVRDAITRNDLQTIFQRFPEGHSCHLPMMLAYHCGLRLGEVFGLTWEDIDLQEGVLSVNRQIQWMQNISRWRFTEPKYESSRTIRLDNVIWALLRREHTRQLQQRLRMGPNYLRYYMDSEDFLCQNDGTKELHLITVRADGSYIQARATQHSNHVIKKELGTHEVRFPDGAEVLEAAQEIVYDYLGREGVKLIHSEGDRAFYRPATDEVVLPIRKQFVSTAEYYSTVFHELTHSTGHPSRLNRLNRPSFFGTEDYSKEELVAEIGAATLVNHVGLETDHSFRNSAAYVQNWLQVLKDDKRFIVSAAGKAEKAVNLILGSAD